MTVKQPKLLLGHQDIRWYSFFLPKPKSFWSIDYIRENISIVYTLILRLFIQHTEPKTEGRRKRLFLFLTFFNSIIILAEFNLARRYLLDTSLIYQGTCEKHLPNQIRLWTYSHLLLFVRSRHHRSGWTKSPAIRLSRDRLLCK